MKVVTFSRPMPCNNGFGHWFAKHRDGTLIATECVTCKSFLPVSGSTRGLVAVECAHRKLCNGKQRGGIWLGVAIKS